LGGGSLTTALYGPNIWSEIDEIRVPSLAL
jgi:hypothetical protein